MEKHNFSADRAIQSDSEDLLERGKFAESIAKAIYGWQGKDSLVIALHGRWGSGKTSLKNMAAVAFKKLNINKPFYFEFNPWQFASQDKIFQSFFDQLASEIGKQHKGEKYEEIAKKVRQYGLYLTTGEKIASSLNIFLTFLFTFSFSSGLGTFFTTEHNTFLWTLCIGLALLASALKWGRTFFEGLFGIYNGLSELNELTLEEFRLGLIDDLKELKEPLLIVIDDIDRLTKKETRMIFQLVKANADFPNIVYLLLFEREVVETRLTTKSQSGREYLEKIIQVPFDIPSIEQGRLENILFKGLDSILQEDPNVLKNFDKDRWGNLFLGCLHKFFKTPRKVYRFLSTLSFHVSLLKGEKVFEVNTVDLIAIECLRVFEPKVYKKISESKDLLTNNITSTTDTDVNAKEVQNIIELASKENRTSVQELITQIFPLTEALLGGFSYGNDYSDEWYKQLRVCSPDLFPRYFQFSVPSGEISHSELTDLIELSTDREKFVSKIKLLELAGLRKSALSQLDRYKQDIPLANHNTFLPALMDIADEVSSESDSFMGFDEHIHLTRIVIWYLRQDAEVSSRGDRLLSAFDKTAGLSLMASLLGSEESRRKDKPYDQESLLTTDKQLNEAKAALIEKISTKAKDTPKEFISNIHLAHLLYKWRHWGNTEDPKQWAQQEIINLELLLEFSEKFIRKSQSHTYGDYITKTENRLDVSGFDNFIPINKAKELIQKGDVSELDEKQIEILSLLESSIEKHEKGISDEDM